MTQPKITNGSNDRPRDVSIGQTAGGLPDDSGRPIEVDEKEAARIEEALSDPDPDESEAHPS